MVKGWDREELVLAAVAVCRSNRAKHFLRFGTATNSVSPGQLGSAIGRQGTTLFNKLTPQWREVDTNEQRRSRRREPTVLQRRSAD